MQLACTWLPLRRDTLAGRLRLQVISQNDDPPSVPRRAYCHSPTMHSGSCMTRLVPCARCSSKWSSPSIGTAKMPPLTPKIPDKIPIRKPSAIPRPTFSIALHLNGCKDQRSSPARIFNARRCDLGCGKRRFVFMPVVSFEAFRSDARFEEEEPPQTRPITPALALPAPSPGPGAMRRARAADFVALTFTDPIA
jgi:hypothetical protein